MCVVVYTVGNEGEMGSLLRPSFARGYGRARQPPLFVDPIIHVEQPTTNNQPFDWFDKLTTRKLPAFAERYGGHSRASD